MDYQLTASLQRLSKMMNSEGIFDCWYRHQLSRPGGIRAESVGAMLALYEREAEYIRAAQRARVNIPAALCPTPEAFIASMGLASIKRETPLVSFSPQVQVVEFGCGGGEGEWCGPVMEVPMKVHDGQWWEVEGEIDWHQPPRWSYGSGKLLASTLGAPLVLRGCAHCHTIQLPLCRWASGETQQWVCLPCLYSSATDGSPAELMESVSEEPTTAPGCKRRMMGERQEGHPASKRVRASRWD